MDVQPPDKRSIFEHALEFASGAEQEAYLENACAGKPEMRAQVDSLLKAHNDVGSFLDGPAFDAQRTAPMEPISEQPGTIIGPYKLLEQIGEGGFGVVYMAEQQQPVRRKVALKVVKPGMDSRQVLTRFEAERQALAIMDHPNIAKVFDAGATDSGRPYFVMELVKGEPITEFCDRNQLPPRERLELFGQVCHAVQHAHQKGIIHRDIKPTNVLVAMHDTTPVVKVIDFGIAKALGQELTDKTLFTGFAEFLGTPLYMSPEQAGESSLDVDTRSDIYSLGVLLYELLTGATPFDKERFRKAAHDEIRRIIREEEPPKPSTRLSESKELLPSISASRHTEPAKLTRLVRGELDWIVMKALEKDRNRRYETANAFAADVEHYLQDQPVLACPPSATYKFRKFARRNKVLIGATAAVAASLIVGIIGTTWQAYRATKAEGVASERLGVVESQKTEIEKEKQKAVAEAERADREAEKAKTEAAIAKAVNDFLNDDLLGMTGAKSQIEADLTPDPNVKLRTLLDRAAGTIEGKFADQPLVEAAIQLAIGRAYRAIGAYQKAEKHSQRAVELRQQELGREHQATLNSMYSLGGVCSAQGRSAEAEKLFQQTLEIQRRTLGDEHPDTLKSMFGLAIVYSTQGRFNEAEKLDEQTLEIRRRVLGDEHPDTLQSMHSLANVYLNQYHYSKAEELLEQTFEIRRRILGDEHPDTLLNTSDLAALYHNQGRYAEAEKLNEQMLEIFRRTLGDEHPHTLTSMHRLAQMYGNQGRSAEAEKLHHQILEIRRRVLGDEHPDTLKCMSSLAIVYSDQGRYAEAEKLYEQTLESLRRTLGDEHPATLKCMHNLAQVYGELHRHDEAEKLQEQTLEIRRRVLGDEAQGTLLSMSGLADVYIKQGRYAEAVTCYKKVIELDPKNLIAYSSLGVALLNQKKLDEAVAAFRKAIELDPKHAIAYSNLGNALYNQNKLDEAIACYKKAIELDPKYATAYGNLSAALHEQGDHPGAIAAFRKSIELDPQNSGIQNNFAWLLATCADVQFRDPARAVELAQEAVKLAPNTADFWNTLGVAQYRDGNFEEAVSALQKYRELRTGDAEWTNPFFLAMAHWQLGNKEEARQWFDKGAQWMDAKNTKSEAMVRFRREAAELLGVNEKK